MRFQTSEMAGTPRDAGPPPNNGGGRRPPDRVRGRRCRPSSNYLLDRASVQGTYANVRSVLSFAFQHYVCARGPTRVAERKMNSLHTQRACDREGITTQHNGGLLALTALDGDLRGCHSP